MKGNKIYKIDIYGLKYGVHQYDFDFNDQFFDDFEDRIIESGKGICEIALDKKQTLIELTFNIQGTIKLICDRSTEEFDYPIALTEQLILKYGEEFDDSEDDIWTIPNTQQTIYVDKILHDYLTLAVPMKKLHPKFEDEEEESEENLELVYSSGIEESEIEVEEEQTDPRWDVLKNIKNLDN